MSTERPWGPNNPNSTHQRWSRWTFVIQAGARRPSRQDVLYNFAKWCRLRFKSTGRYRLDIDMARAVYQCMVEVEGPPVHDPDYRTAIIDDFKRTMVAQGFGVGAFLRHGAGNLLAGSAQDGRPPTQLIVMPPLSALIGGS